MKRTEKEGLVLSSDQFIQNAGFETTLTDQPVNVYACETFCETVDKKCNALQQINSFKSETFEPVNCTISICIRDAFC